MKIVFFGTPEFAAINLRALIKGSDQIVATFTQPDRPKGRGKSILPSPTKVVSESNNIPTYSPSTLKGAETVDLIKKYSPDLIIVVAFGQIFPKNILNIAPHGCINSHASLLPKYRGAAPIQRSIMQGSVETGISIIKLVEELDAGPVLWKKKINIGPDDTFGIIHDKLAELSVIGLLETCALIRSNKLNPQIQDDKNATYASKLIPKEELIEWSLSAKSIHDHIRALDPTPGAYSTIGGERVKLFSSHLIKATGKGIAGEIISVEKDGIIIHAGEGELIIKEVQLANKKRMSATDFVRGARISKGLKFGD